jgi:hypothetical protein
MDLAQPVLSSRYRISHPLPNTRERLRGSRANGLYGEIPGEAGLLTAALAVEMGLGEALCVQSMSDQDHRSLAELG